MNLTRIAIDEHIIQVKLLNVEKNPMFVSDIFETISKYDVNIDMISSVMLEDQLRIDFTTSDDQHYKLNKAFTEIKKKHPRMEIYALKNAGKLIVEGKYMETEAGVASKIFHILGEHQIPFTQVTTSEISMSFVIEKTHLKDAYNYIMEANKNE